jgi:hypothetical protein
MENEPRQRLARIDRHEVAALPSEWTDLEKGRQLRYLLRERGIDPNRLYFLTYHPRHHCWLITQQAPETGGASVVTPGKSDDVFYRQLAVELRRTARLACASQGAWWLPYRVADQPEPITPSDLAHELSAAGDPPMEIRFNCEGGWGPSLN